MSNRWYMAGLMASILGVAFAIPPVGRSGTPAPRPAAAAALLTGDTVVREGEEPHDDAVVQMEGIPSDSIPVDSLAVDSLAVDSISAVPMAMPAVPVPKSTPVDIDREAPAAPPMHYYDRHGEPLQTPVRFLAELDTVTKAKAAPTYHAFNGVSIGANFFDAVMMAIGQRRASFDIWADCSIHNWFFPVVEAGIGFSDARPDDGRCHFKVAPTPYLRVGMNYNFLYKSNPDYQFYLGLRAGWSTFGYDIYSIQAGSEYYTADGPTQRTGLRSTAFYGQALAGLKVKIWRGLFMGWSVRYNFNIHQSYSDPDYPAWFTPGKGTSTPIMATFSIGWTFGNRPPRPVVSEEVEALQEAVQPEVKE